MIVVPRDARLRAILLTVYQRPGRSAYRHAAVHCGSIVPIGRKGVLGA